MEDRDSGQRTTALVTALWRAPWIWRWFVQPAIVRFGGGGGVADHADPHTNMPLRCAHTLVEVARPLVCGGGTTANVGEVTCAMGWFKCWGSGTKRGRTEDRCELEGAWEPQKQKKGKQRKKGADGSGLGRCNGDACTMQGRRPGDERRNPWALPW